MSRQHLPACVVAAIEKKDNNTPFRGDAVVFIDEDGEALSVKVVGNGWAGMRAAVQERAIDWLRGELVDEGWITEYGEEMELLGSQLKDAIECEDDEEAFGLFKAWVERWTSVLDVQRCPAWVTAVPAKQWENQIFYGNPMRVKLRSVSGATWDDHGCWTFPFAGLNCRIPDPGGSAQLYEYDMGEQRRWVVLGINRRIGYVYLTLYALNLQLEDPSELEEVCEKQMHTDEEASAELGYDWTELSDDEIAEQLINSDWVREVSA